MVRRYFYAWRNAGLFETINTVLVMNRARSKVARHFRVVK